MRYARASSRVTLAAIVLAALAAPVPSIVAAQEKDEAFRAGVEAMKEKQWPKVVAEMQRAIQENSTESPRKVGRLFGRTDYLPYYFLGEAHFRQNDCVNAVLAWESSIKQGVVQTRPEYYSQLQKGNAECEEKGVLLPDKFGAAVSRAHAQVDAANVAMTKVKAKGDDFPNVWRAQPKFAAEYLGASNEYEAARKHLEVAKRSRLGRDFDEVAKAAARAKDLSDTLERDLNAAIEKARGILGEADVVRQSIKDAQAIDEEIETKKTYLTPPLVADRSEGMTKLENALEQLHPRRLSESSLAAARTSVTEGAGLLTKVRDSVQAAYLKVNKLKLDRAAGLATAAFSRADAELQIVQGLIERHPAKATPQIRDSFEKTQKQFVSARRKHDIAMSSQQVVAVEAAASEADAIQARLLALEESIGVALTLEDRGVPTWLQEGAGRYFAGDYAGALDRLDDGTAADTVQLHVHLFRAAAQHALYVRSGEKDTVRRDQAMADIKRCKELGGAFAPDTRAFSPAFLEFYQRDGAAPQTASPAQ